MRNKNPPTPCLWQAPASTQKTKRKARPAVRRSARWRAKGAVQLTKAGDRAHGARRRRRPWPKRLGISWFLAGIPPSGSWPTAATAPGFAAVCRSPHAMHDDATHDDDTHTALSRRTPSAQLLSLGAALSAFSAAHERTGDHLSPISREAGIFCRHPPGCTRVMLAAPGGFRHHRFMRAPSLTARARVGGREAILPTTAGRGSCSETLCRLPSHREDALSRSRLSSHQAIATPSASSSRSSHQRRAARASGSRWSPGAMQPADRSWSTSARGAPQKHGPSPTSSSLRRILKRGKRRGAVPLSGCV